MSHVTHVPARACMLLFLLLLHMYKRNKYINVHVACGMYHIPCTGKILPVFLGSQILGHAGPGPGRTVPLSAIALYG